MLRLTTLLQRLGPQGAVGNVRSVLDERRREDWVVEGLLRRLEPAPTAVPAAAPARPARVA